MENSLSNYEDQYLGIILFFVGEDSQIFTLSKIITVE